VHASLTEICEERLAESLRVVNSYLRDGHQRGSSCVNRNRSGRGSLPFIISISSALGWADPTAHTIPYRGREGQMGNGGPWTSHSRSRDGRVACMRVFIRTWVLVRKDLDVQAIRGGSLTSSLLSLTTTSIRHFTFLPTCEAPCLYALLHSHQIKHQHCLLCRKRHPNRRLFQPFVWFLQFHLPWAQHQL
jgi:hypothetical protein